MSDLTVCLINSPKRVGAYISMCRSSSMEPAGGNARVDRPCSIHRPVFRTSSTELVESRLGSWPKSSASASLSESFGSPTPM